MVRRAFADSSRAQLRDGHPSSTAGPTDSGRSPDWTTAGLLGPPHVGGALERLGIPGHHHRSWWDGQRPPSAEDQRYQLVLDRTARWHGPDTNAAVRATSRDLGHGVRDAR